MRQGSPDARYSALMSRKKARRPYAHDTAAFGAAVAAHLQRLAKAVKNHPHEAVAPKLGMAAAATALRLGPRVIATVSGNSVEIQFEIGYHELAFVFGGGQPPGLRAVGGDAPAAPFLPNKNGPCSKRPFNPKSATYLSTHSEINHRLHDCIMRNPTRLEVFAELHTLCQFDKDSKPYLPLILAGQSLLIDKLCYRDCAPLASRVICRAHLQGLDKRHAAVPAPSPEPGRHQKAALR